MKNCTIASIILIICITTLSKEVIAQQVHHASNLEMLHLKISAALPGDTIVMAKGIWRDASILFEADGVEGDSITLRAEIPGEVILTGRSHLRIAGNYLRVDGLVFADGFVGDRDHVVQFRKDSGKWANHSRFTNSAIIDYNHDDVMTYNRWVSLYGTHNRVDHNLFKGKVNDGTTIVVWLHDKPNYHRIDNNHFLDRPDIPSDDAETIRIGTSTWSMHDSRTIVEYNLFERCNGEGEIISNKSGENIYRYNTFLESEGALTLRHGNRALVDGNFFIGNYKPRTGGVRVLGDDHIVINNYFEGLMGDGLRSTLTLGNGYEDPPLNSHFRANRAIVAFNTFYDNRTTFDIGYGLRPGRILPPKDVTIANNLVYTSRSPIITETDEPENMVFEGNIMYADFIDVQPQRLGIPQPAGIHLADPQFVRALDGLYRPGPESPAIGSAQGEYAFVVDDMDGQPRPQGLPWDVGADQASTEPVLRGPLGPGDVGPRWRGSMSLTDSLALVALYHQTNGPGWTDNTGWLQAPVAQWHGVQGLSALMRVTRLDLSDNNLSGSIPGELWQLLSLQELDLSGNDLQGNIPQTIEHLSGLERLNLEDNRLSGPVPIGLSSLARLKSLRLSGNELSGAIPAELGQLSGLQELSLSGNRFSPGSLPEWLGQLGSLRVLEFARAGRTGEVPSWVGGMQGLQVLALDGNALSGAVSQVLSHLSQLDSLNLGFNQLAGQLPEELGGLSELNALVVSGNAGLEGPVPMSYTSLLRMRVFHYDQTGLCEPDQASFRSWLSYIQSNPNPLVHTSVQGTGVVCVETMVKDHEEVPQVLGLHQNYPNPFNPQTVIGYEVPSGGLHVRLEVYDMLGRHVATLVDEVREAGRYQAGFDGRGLSSGMYMYRLEAGNQVILNTMMLLK